MTGAFAFGKLAPRRDRMTAAARTSFTAAHRMVDRVLNNAADMRTETEMTFLAGFAHGSVHVIEIADLADGGLAVEVDHADFTAGQFDLSIIAVFGAAQASVAE